MSHEPHNYRPTAPGSNADDEDSDLDLDLQELDPIDSSIPGPSSSRRRSRDGRRRLEPFGGRIPLRNLRVGRNRRRGDYDGLGASHGREGGGEDTRGLLEDGDSVKRLSDGSVLSGDDDAPLLGGGSRMPASQRMPSLRQHTLVEKIGRTLRIPGLSDSEYQSPCDEDEAETDHDPSSNRTVAVGQRQTTRFPPNAISNAKYTPWSFLPKTLYNEFSFFINMYFLLVALSQIIPALRIGYLLTYILPLAFVVSVTLTKEAVDDVARRRRDAEANSELYTVLKFEDIPETNGHVNGNQKRAKGGRLVKLDRPESRGGHQGLGISFGDRSANVREMKKRASELRVGDVLKLSKDRRVPADVVVLQSSSVEFGGDKAALQEDHDNLDSLVEDDSTVGSAKQDDSANANSSGEAFIKTDQLDGETDWKLRLANPLTQTLDVGDFSRLQVIAGKPDKKVNEFVGTIELLSNDSPSVDRSNSNSAPLTIDNTAWANTVLASSTTVYAVVLYTGPQTRQALSTSQSRSKTGLLEYEINSLVKILCILTLSLSFLLVAVEGFEVQDGRQWYISVLRYLVLFSTIVPISLRVNLDMGKTVYAWFIEHDHGIPGTVVRTSTIPEDLGRVEYLLSDKTGTLTQNGMLPMFNSHQSTNLGQRWS